MLPVWESADDTPLPCSGTAPPHPLLIWSLGQWTADSLLPPHQPQPQPQQPVIAVTCYRISFQTEKTHKHPAIVTIKLCNDVHLECRYPRFLCCDVHDCLQTCKPCIFAADQVIKQPEISWQSLDFSCVEAVVCSVYDACIWCKERAFIAAFSDYCTLHRQTSSNIASLCLPDCDRDLCIAASETVRKCQVPL